MNTTTTPRFSLTPAIPAKERRKALLFNFKFGAAQISVPYQEYRSGRARYWMIFYHDAGQRRRESRASLHDAKDRARQIALNIVNGQTRMSAFSEADRAEYLAGRQNLAACGESLITATAEHARRQKILSEKQIAFDVLVANWDATRPRVSGPHILSKVVDEYLADRTGHISKDHHAHRAHQLSRLSAFYTGPIHSLQRVDVDIWLRSLGVGPITRRGYYDSARELLRYAESRGYIASDHPLLKRSIAPPRPAGEIKILTIEQAVALLSRAPENLTVFIAMQLFAGLRHSEAARLDWRDVHLQEAEPFIYVSKAIGKGQRDRHVPISANLAAWLAPHIARSGPITGLSQTSGALTRAKRRAGIAAGKNETKNILRKTFISYRKAAIQNVAQVAEEAGNSVGIIHKHYGRPIPQAEGKRLFDIWPTSGDVLQLDFNLA